MIVEEQFFTGLEFFSAVQDIPRTPEFDQQIALVDDPRGQCGRDVIRAAGDNRDPRL